MFIVRLKPFWGQMAAYFICALLGIVNYNICTHSSGMSLQLFFCFVRSKNVQIIAFNIVDKPLVVCDLKNTDSDGKKNNKLIRTKTSNSHVTQLTLPADQVFNAVHLLSTFTHYHRSVSLQSKLSPLPLKVKRWFFCIFVEQKKKKISNFALSTSFAFAFCDKR